MNRVPTPINDGREFTVFISCPPGPDYRDVRYGLTLAVIASGHRAVADFDSYDWNPRGVDPQRLYELISSSRYSIHDCTLCSGNAPDQFGRFNIPVDLGMALLERQQTADKDGFHEILICTQNDHPYNHFLYGLNSPNYFGYSSCSDAIKRAFVWLRSKDTVTHTPQPDVIKPVWEAFLQKQHNGNAGESEQDDLSFVDLHDQILSLCREQSWWEDQSWLKFDVFMAYNSHDKAEVKVIAERLRQRKIRPWLDEEQIPPGVPFIDQLQQAIPNSKAAAIIFGQNGVGRWQKREIDVLLMKTIETNLPLIPVLLPSIQSEPDLPLFLRMMNWVRFSSFDDAGALARLIWGVTGKQLALL